MIEIELTRGHTALIDDEDLDLILPHSWHLLVSKGRHKSVFYARTKLSTAGPYPLMHTFLTGWGVVDHINGNGLDNRRANLREASRQENMRNRRKHARSASKYKGVAVYQQDRSRWIAQIGHEGKRYFLGIFADEVGAALAYDAAARKRFGEFAALNFPEPGERSALADLDYTVHN